ncbi:hypothetical protein CQW23_00806 [Capsicum baccatum]|uniref:Ubiquitin-like protease family profile domain-containing protein n=1 Tax=Capsicum baccatum TaxID=33114 RepID=A0A2G2XLR8_CAPBA|nr:hypothetical protein CQW23_00806 [Capsicum baccatum]
MELFGATTITKKITLEGGLIVVDDGSGRGSATAVGANDAPLTVFETTNYYDYDHTGYTDFVTSSKYSACQCQDCKAKHNGVINAINALTASVKEITSNRCVIPSNRISYPYTLLEIKVDEVYIPINYGDEFYWVLAVVVLKERHIRVYDSISQRRCRGPSSEIQKSTKILPTYIDMSDFLDQKIRTDWSTIEAYQDKMKNPFDVQYVEGISQQTIVSLDWGFFVATYAEYLSDGLQVSNDGLDAELLRKR